MQGAVDLGPVPRPSSGSPLSPGAPSRLAALEVEDLQPWFPELEIVRLLGQGGMGAVYLARQPKLDRLVALKVLLCPEEWHDNFALRFEQEARLLARLNHPRIVSLIDSGEIDRSASQQPPLFFFLMEYVDGTSLDRLIAKRELTPNRALSIAVQVCEALQHAHGKGVIHRDIKPANLLVDCEGGVRVADFGLANLANEAATPLTTNLTITGSSMGTPLYMAPENWNAPDELDHRADLYALAVILYEMLTGDRPAGVFDPPSADIEETIDPRIDDLVMKALSKKPEARYQSAESLRQALDDILDVPSVKRSTPRRAWFFAAAAGIVALVLVAVTLADRGNSNPPDSPDPSLPAPAPTPAPRVNTPALADPGVLRGIGHAAAVTAAQGLTDIVQIRIDPDSRKYALLRANGDVISNIPWMRRKKNVVYLGHTLGFRDDIVCIHDDGSFSYSIKQRVVRPKRVAYACLTMSNGLLLYEDGTVEPWWGPNVESDRDQWQAADPEALRDVIGIATIPTTSAVLKADGSVMAWNKDGMISLPEELGAGIRKIHFWNWGTLLALDEDNHLWVCNREGELIDNLKREKISAFAVGNLDSLPSLRTDKGDWQPIFPSSPLKEALDGKLLEAFSNLKGLPPEAFDFNTPSKTGPPSFLLWIEPLPADSSDSPPEGHVPDSFP